MAFDIYEKLGVESSAKKNPPKFNIRERLGVDKPKENNAGYNIVGGVKDLGKLLYDLPVQTKGAVGAMLEGDDPAAEINWKDRWRDEAQARSSLRNSALTQQERRQKVIPLPDFMSESGALTRGDIQDASGSSGFTIASMAASLGGAAAASPGGPWASVPAGMAAGGAAAYKMDKTFFTDRIIDAAAQAKGRELTDSERKTLLAETKDIRNNHALWEAGPEAVGNALSMTGIGRIFKGATQKGVTKMVSGLITSLGGELSTETITQIGQNIEEHNAGVGDGEKMSFADPGSYARALKEVGPGVAVLQGLGGGGAAAAGAGMRQIQKRQQPQQTEQPQDTGFPGTLGEEFAIGMRQPEPTTFEDIESARDFARGEREARLYNQRLEDAGIRQPEPSFEDITDARDAQAFGAEALRQNQIRNTRDQRRNFTGRDTTPATVDAPYAPDLPPYNAPEIITNRGGGVFKSEAAAIGEVNKRKADGLYTAVPQDDGFVAQRIQSEGAFTKKDGTGFATETALSRIASKERVALDEYQVLKTNKGFIAVPQERTDGTARQEGVDGNQTADTGGVADVAQTEQGRVGIPDADNRGVEARSADAEEQSGQVRPAAGLRAEVDVGEQQDGGNIQEPQLRGAVSAESENALPRDIDEAPDENRPVEKIGETDVRYEGSDSNGLHYYTALSGPSAGGTFAVENQEPASIETALKNQEAKFTRDEAPGDIAANAFQTAQRTGTPTQTTVGQFLKTAAAQNESKSVKAIATVLDKVINKQRANGSITIDPTARVSYYDSGTNDTVIRANAETKEGMHEVFHALTAREIKSNKNLKNKIKSLSSQVKAQAIKQGLLTQEQITEIESLGTSREFKTQQDSYGDNRGIAYAFLNEREFLAQAMNSPSFQQLLVDTKIKRGGKLRSAWDAFVDMVASAMGLPKSVSKTAFAEVLSVTTAVARSAPGSEIQAFDEAIDEAPDFLNETAQAGKEKVTQAAKALAKLKGKPKEIYEQYAPQWLSVTPLNTLVQTFGKKIQQIRDFAKYIDEMGYVKSDIVTTAFNHHKEARDLANKSVGEDKFNEVMELASYYRMTPWAGIMEQDWVPGKDAGNKAQRLFLARKAWTDSGLKKQSGGLTYDAAYKKAVAEYNKLNDRTKEAYEKIVNHISSLRDREKNNLLAEIEQNTEEGSDLRAKLMEQYERSFPKIGGAYIPLSRHGDFILEFQDIDGVRVVQHFNTIAERSAAIDILEQSDGIDNDTIKADRVNRKSGGAVAIPKMLMGQLSEAVEENYLKNVDPENEDAVAVAKDRAASTIENMNQVWLRWQPETSALKNSIRRSNVRGYDKNMLRSYIDYAQRHASSIAWIEQGKKIEQTLADFAEDINEEKKDGRKDVTMKRNLLNDLRARVDAIRSVHVGGIASRLGKLGTAYYMTSPSIALVQMSQLGVLTLPKLSVMYGPAKTVKAMRRAMGKAFKKDYSEESLTGTSEDAVAVNNVFDNIRRVVTEKDRAEGRGKDKAIGENLYSDEEIQKQVNDLGPKQQEMLALREALARNLLDISATHEAQNISRSNDPDAMTSKIFDLAMQPMKQSELASRKIAVLSTFELAKADGKNFKDAMDAVGTVVNETLFNYSKDHKGAKLQGGQPRVILMFQHFRMMTAIRLALLFRDSILEARDNIKLIAKERNIPWKDLETAATKEFVGIMGVTGVLAGTTGLPMANVLFYIMDTMLGDDDEPIDSKLMFTNWLREKSTDVAESIGLGEKTGEKLANVIDKGALTLVGADISRRIGLGDVYGVQNTPPPGMHGKQLAAWWAATQLGPVFSVASGWLQGFDEMFRKGNFMRGLEDATPKPIRDVLKSYRVATEGVKTRSGERLLNDDEVSADDVFMLALGFYPSEISKVSEAQRAKYTLSTKISERRGKLTRDAARAILEGDTIDALEDIRTFNRKMPVFAIGGGDIRRAVRQIILGDMGIQGRRDTLISQQYGVPSY